VKPGLSEQLGERLGREVPTVSDAAVEGRHRTAWHGDDQPASWLEVRHDATQQALWLIDVLEHLGAHRGRRPAAQPGFDLRIAEQITLHERRAGDGDACSLDAFAAQFDADDVGGRKPPPQIGRERAGARADVEDPVALPAVDGLQQTEDQPAPVCLGRIALIRIRIGRPVSVPVVQAGRLHRRSPANAHDGGRGCKALVKSAAGRKAPR